MTGREAPARSSTRWQYRDPALLWLLPATYVAHVAEEGWLAGGFVRWAAETMGGRLTDGMFLAGNALGIVLTIAAVRLAVRDARHGWLAVGLAATFALNAATHAGASLATRTFSPGLLTGVVFWIPLGLLILLRAWHQARVRTFWGGMAAGAVTQMVVMALALRGVPFP
jgi:hypothetical protein